MSTEMILIIVGIAVALGFDFINGMNDAANSVATIVSTRVLAPFYAVLWAAFFNFAAVFIFGIHVAKTIGKGIVAPQFVDPTLIFGALIGAIVWASFATWRGLPVSVSHSLIGGLIGAAFIKGGQSALLAPGIAKIVLFIFLAPIIGFLAGALIMAAIAWVLRNMPPGKVNKYFRFLQLCSSAAFSLGHGGNDAQKTMGIIAMLLFAGGILQGEFFVPYWVIFASYFTIALGTFAGGWRVIKTLGINLTKLTPSNGFAAETAAALTLFGTAQAGIPASTTHTITGAIMGVGSLRRLSAVRWGIAGNIVFAWILTIPVAALVAAGCYKILVTVL
jgi:PiT family inorganic phosphate transporter